MHCEDSSLLTTQKGDVCFIQLAVVEDVKSFMEFCSTLMDCRLHQSEPPRDILVHVPQDYLIGTIFT